MKHKKRLREHFPIDAFYLELFQNSHYRYLLYHNSTDLTTVVYGICGFYYGDTYSRAGMFITDETPEILFMFQIGSAVRRHPLNLRWIKRAQGSDGTNQIVYSEILSIPSFV